MSEQIPREWVMATGIVCVPARTLEVVPLRPKWQHCLATSPHGRRCSRLLGHGGRHHAGLPSVGMVTEVWERQCSRRCIWATDLLADSAIRRIYTDPHCDLHGSRGHHSLVEAS